MVRGVAQSSVYVLYLTSDALSYYVTIEARAAMELGKPLVLLMENDSRKPSYAGGSVEKATEGWPQDLKEYFWSGRHVSRAALCAIRVVKCARVIASVCECV